MSSATHRTDFQAALPATGLTTHNPLAFAATGCLPAWSSDLRSAHYNPLASAATGCLPAWRSDLRSAHYNPLASAATGCLPASGVEMKLLNAFPLPARMDFACALKSALAFARYTPLKASYSSYSRGLGPYRATFNFRGTPCGTQGGGTLPTFRVGYPPPR